MVYTRSQKKKSYRKKRRYNRKKSVIPRNKLSSKVYHFKRYRTPLYLYSAASVFEGFSYSFTLSDLPDYTEYTKLFDQFRINMVKIYFIPNGNVNQIDPVIATQPSDYWNCIYTAIDTNDTTAPNNDNVLRQYSTFKFSPNLKIHKRIVYPKPLIELYKSAVTTGYSNLPNSQKMWVSTNDSTIPYYGIKGGFDNPTATNGYLYYKVQMVYYMSFRNSK